MANDDVTEDADESTEVEDSIASDISSAIDEVLGSPESTDKEAAPAKDAATPEKQAATAKPAAEKANLSDQASRKAEKTGEAQAAPAIIPPISWSAESKEKFSQLPPELQKEIADRERSRDHFVNQKSREMSQVLTEHQQISAVASPFFEEMRAARVDPVQGLDALIKGHNFIKQNPREAIQQIAAREGIDLRELTLEGGQQQLDPRYNQIENGLREVQQTIAQQQSAVEMQKKAQIDSTVDSFLAATDESGQARFPYAQDAFFQEEMSTLVKILRAEYPQATPQALLEEAYERTAWALPQTRDLEIRKQQAAFQKAEQAKVSAARRAGVSISGGPGAPAATVRSTGDLRSDLEAAFDAFNN